MSHIKGLPAARNWDESSTIFAYVLAIMAGWFQPAIVEGLRTGLQFSHAAAGIAAGVEVAAVGIGSLVLGAKLPVLPIRLRTLGLIACLLVVLGNVLSMIAAQFELLLLGRIISGAGQACAFSAATNVLATRIAPARLGKVIAAYTLLEGLIILLLPSVLERYAHTGVFGLMASLGLLLAPFIALLPNDRPVGTDDGGQQGGRKTNWLLFAGSTSWATIAGMVWASSFEIGKNIGLTIYALGLVSSLCVLCGAIGSLAASGTLTGRLRLTLLTGAIVSQSGIIVLTIFASHSVVFVGSLLATSFMTYFCYPLFLSLAGDMDASGRLSGLIAASFYVGGFIGPVAGGLLLTWFNNFGVLALVTGLSIVPILVMIFLSVARTSLKHAV